MAKFSRVSKLSVTEQEHILYEFALALSEIHNSQEALEFIRDLLSEQEAEMLAKRIKIAELLLDGLTYQEVQNAMKTSHTTIARVGEWLRRSGSGYRIVVDRIKKKLKSEPEPNREPSEWSKLKRRYPMMFWPQLVLEEIVASANKRQKKRLQAILQEMDEKSDMYKELRRVLA